MKYKVIERKNPLTQSAKYYANAVNEGKVSLRDLAQQIEGRSSLTRGDIQNVLENFIDLLPLFLKMGNSVKLGDFGTIRLNIKNKNGAASAEEFSTALIDGVKVIFTPGVQLKGALKDVHFEKQ